MALTDDNNNGIGATMLVGPAGYANNNGGCGFGNGDWSWIIVLFLFAMMGGGFGGWGGFGGGFGNMFEFPWLLNGQNGINNNVNDGFRSAQISDGITSVRDGIAGLSTQLCGCCGDMQMSLANGFAGVQQSLCNGFAGTTAAVTAAQNGITQQIYSNELASLNRSFAEQTANTAGFNSVQSALCDIRYGDATNTRDIIESQTRGTQAVLDKLCALEIDNYRRENDQLRTQLNMASLAASQNAQTAQIRDGQNASVAALVNELRSCPIPSQPVYGSQPIFTCPNNNNGCGCGCGVA